LQVLLERQTVRNEMLLRQTAIQVSALSSIRGLSDVLAQPKDVTQILGDVLIHCLDAACASPKSHPSRWWGRLAATAPESGAESRRAPQARGRSRVPVFAGPSSEGMAPENLAVRQQLVVLHRARPKRLRINRADRIFWA
jgi:hypothetical protein